MMPAVIDAVICRVLAALTECRRLGPFLNQRAAEVLALFNHPGMANGPTKAVNWPLEHLRGSAFGFANLTHYIADRSSTQAALGLSCTFNYNWPLEERRA